MGMQLIEGFNEQLEGRLTIKSEGGFVISISFPHSTQRPGRIAIHLAENEATIDV
jgi:two-component sensor histidine kinase